MAGDTSRVHFRSAIVGGLVVGAMLLAAPPAVSALASLVLGETNTANSRTTLTGRVKTTNLRIENKHNAGSAVALSVKPGNPPMKVDSSTKVQGLHADKLDGLSAHQLVRVAHDETDDAETDGNVLTVSIKAPVDGFVFISGGVNGDQVEPGAGPMYCRFSLDGQVINASERLITHRSIPGDPASIGLYSYCQSSVTVPVSSGAHTVRLNWQSGASLPAPGEASLTAVFIPFDGNGKRP
ncbi:MAG TPA: hypothetical protein VGC11_04335 [Acidimicrobiia bacterium]|jgi:hypothetical protein